MRTIRVKYKRLYILLLLPLSVMLTQAARLNIAFADYYSINIYPVLARAIGFVTGLIPWSLAEIFVIAGVMSIAGYTIFAAVRAIRRKALAPLGLYAMNMAVIASLFFLMYTLLCGMNYYRHQFTTYSGLEIKPSTKEELVSLCEDLAERAGTLRTKVDVNKDNRAVLSDSNYYETAARARTAFSGVAQRYSVLSGTYPGPKPVFFSKAMSYLQISGIYFPLTVEANVNVDIPDHQIPVTMCHELTHLRGFMREDEANFIAYLACVSSGYDDFAYSGTMLALTYSMNALHSADYDEFERIYGTYTEGVRGDMRYVSQYWKQFETKIGEISDKVNDTYLKANNQEDGVKSYGRMVDLLLAEHRQKIGI